MKKQYSYYALLIGLSIIMVIIDSMGGFAYWLRSLIKIVIFGLLPAMVLIYNKHKFNVWDKGKHIKVVLLTSVVVVSVVISVFYLLLPYGVFDFVVNSLETQVGVNTNNYPFVFIYIVLVNGPLEEFFFRYVMQLDEFSMSKSKRIILSSLFFSIYHVGMLYNMFAWYLFAFAIIGLVIVGIFFSWVNSFNRGITYSIIIHMAANLAINTIGAILLYSL